MNKTYGLNDIMILLEEFEGQDIVCDVNGSFNGLMFFTKVCFWLENNFICISDINENNWFIKIKDLDIKNCFIDNLIGLNIVLLFKNGMILELYRL